MSMTIKITDSGLAKDLHAFLFHTPNLTAVSKWRSRFNKFTDVFSLVFWIFLLARGGALLPLTTAPLTWVRENPMMAWATWAQIAPRLDAIARRRGRNIAGKALGLCITEILGAIAVGFRGREAVRERDLWKGVQAASLGVVLLLLLGIALWIKARLKGEQSAAVVEENGEKSRQFVDL